MTHSLNYSVLSDPRQYSFYWLSRNKITVNPTGNLVDPAQRNNGAIFDSLWLDYLADTDHFNKIEKMKAQNIRNAVRILRESDMQKALNELIDKEMITARENLTSSIRCTTENLAPITDFVKALTGSSNSNAEAVIAHWIWSIKNKMRNAPVKHHIMPILFGTQGSGKSVAVNKLVTPIQDYRLDISMQQLIDERYAETMSKNFVVVFDEMQGAARTDVDALKKQVSIEYNTFRPMRSTTTYKVKQSCSFIGTTNKPISEQILDSGMRRFYEIKCLTKADWVTINSINYQDLWSGVDENRPDGYLADRLESIREEQSELVTKEQIDIFLEQMQLDNSKPADKQVKVSDLYGTYSYWAKESGYKPMDIGFFGKKMSSRGYKSKAIKIKGNVNKYYSVNSDYGYKTLDTATTH